MPGHEGDWRIEATRQFAGHLASLIVAHDRLGFSSSLYNGPLADHQGQCLVLLRKGLVRMTNVDLLTIVGIWFSGVGAFLASGVALWIASQPRRIKLDAFVGLRTIVQPGLNLTKEVIAFGVTNLGDKPVTISCVGWRTGKRRKWRQMLVVKPGPLANNYPMTLGRGESATFTMCEEDSVEALSVYWNDTAKWGMDGDKLAKSLKGQVHTTLNTLPLTHYP